MENNFHPEALCAYLVVDEQVVYAVAPNSVLNIGRLDTNDVVLDDYKVSREHAVMKFSGSEIMLVDLASTHGSFVNGQRIDRSIIRFEDKVQIVSHELRLCHEMPPEASDNSMTMITPKMARALDRRLKFFGGLNEFALITLVQFLHQEKQSGLLLLEVGQNPGPRIYFVDGDIIHVSRGENLAELLVRQNHEPSLFFYFHHETNFPPRTIEESTPNYLIGLCHSHDENLVRKADDAATWLTKPLSQTSRVPLPPMQR